MNTTVAASRRVLVVEPDPAKARVLDGMLRSCKSFQLEIVSNADEAARSMTRTVPDLLMTSAILSLADVTAITDYARGVSRASRLPIVDLPYFDSGSSAPTTAPRRGVFRFGFLRRRAAAVPSRFDERKRLREHIEQYLEQAVSERQPLADRLDAALLAPAQSLLLVPAPAGSAALAECESALRRPTRSVLGQRLDRRRARRQRLEDLPLRWQLKLPGASDINIVNISTRGVLLETASQISHGTILDLHLVGQDRDLSVPARMLRTEVVGGGVLDIRYRVAAAFVRELELLESRPGPAAPEIASIAGTLNRFSAEIDRAAQPATARRV